MFNQHPGFRRFYNIKYYADEDGGHHEGAQQKYIRNLSDKLEQVKEENRKLKMENEELTRLLQSWKNKSSVNLEQENRELREKVAFLQGLLDRLGG